MGRGGEAPEKKAPAGASASRITELCTNVKSRDWFSLQDCSNRLVLSIFMFYWFMVRHPVDFALFTWRYNRIWIGPYVGALATLLYPVMPFFYIPYTMFNMVRAQFEDDWMMKGPGRIFFLQPEGLLATFVWKWYLDVSMYVGAYLIGGSDADSVSHTWQDTTLNKHYWRRLLEQGQANTPRLMAQWKDQQLQLHHDLPEDTTLVAKIPDSYLGIGDNRWDRGEHFSSVSELEELCRKTYEQKEAVLTEFVKPVPELGVHLLDIITLRTKRHGVVALQVIYWSDCTEWSSHSCQNGYVVDAASEMVVAGAPWYSPYFASTKPEHVGKVLPGVREACQMAVRAHESSELPWLNAVGWDVMLTPRGPVFFEGNFACARLPRRMFLGPENMQEFLLQMQ